MKHRTPHYTGGNITPYAEFNIYADPLAASEVLQSGLPIVLVPLDVTERCRLRYGVYKDVVVPTARQAPMPSFVTAFLRYIYDFMAECAEDLSGGIRESSALSIHHYLSNEKLANNAFHHAPAASPSDSASPPLDGRNTPPDTHGLLSMAMHDPICMGICIDPSIIRKVHSMPIDVEVSEEAVTRGMCLVDGRWWRLRKTVKEERKCTLETKPGSEDGVTRKSVDGAGARPVDVVMRVDVDAFFDRFMCRVFGLRWDKEKHGWRGLE